MRAGIRSSGIIGFWRGIPDMEFSFAAPVKGDQPGD
jgi:hypothetical protein